MHTHAILEKILKLKDTAMSKIQKVLVTGKTRTTGFDAEVISGNHEGMLNIDVAVNAITA
jgi:hypothetical protein